MFSFDPLSIITMILMQIGGKYLNFNITKAQEKIIKHPFFQSIIFFSIIYIGTKDFFISFTVLIITYLLIKVLLNENHKYNILSKSWLKKEGIIFGNDDIGDISFKKLYYNNFKDIHQ